MESVAGLFSFLCGCIARAVAVALFLILLFQKGKDLFWCFYDEVGFVGNELCFGSKSPECSDGSYSSGAGGLYVHFSVTNVENGMGGKHQSLGSFEGAGGIGLSRPARLLAEYGLKLPLR